ncbi:MAG: ribbon-helix-helix protein, CopG family [Patescibacteria group bacterium]
MARTTTIVNFSAPPKLARQIEMQAKKEGKTKSELLRKALESYLFKKDFRELQKYGRTIAEKLGLETYDDIEEYLEGK